MPTHIVQGDTAGGDLAKTYLNPQVTGAHFTASGFTIADSSGQVWVVTMSTSGSWIITKLTAAPFIVTTGLGGAVNQLITGGYTSGSGGGSPTLGHSIGLLLSLTYSS